MGAEFITCYDRNGGAHRVPTRDVSFRPSVYGILLQHGTLLLLPQFDGYDFPGGGMEVGETITAALLREFKEETGLGVELGKLLHCGSKFYYSEELSEAWNCILIYYLVHSPKGDLSMKGFDEHEQRYARRAEWIDATDALSLKFYNGIDSPALIQRALAARSSE